MSLPRLPAVHCVCRRGRLPKSPRTHLPSVSRRVSIHGCSCGPVLVKYLNFITCNLRCKPRTARGPRVPAPEFQSLITASHSWPSRVIHCNIPALPSAVKQLKSHGAGQQTHSPGSEAPSPAVASDRRRRPGYVTRRIIELRVVEALPSHPMGQPGERAARLCASLYMPDPACTMRYKPPTAYPYICHRSGPSPVTCSGACSRRRGAMLTGRDYTEKLGHICHVAWKVRLFMGISL